MGGVALSAKKRVAGAMGDEKLQRAIAALQEEGYVVVENAVSDEPLDVLQEKMDEDARF